MSQRSSQILSTPKRNQPGLPSRSLRVQSLICIRFCDPIDYDPTDCSPPGSSVHGGAQAQILEWITISSFRGSFPPRDQTRVSCVSCTGRQIFFFFNHWATWEAPLLGERSTQKNHLVAESKMICTEMEREIQENVRERGTDLGNLWKQGTIILNIIREQKIAEYEDSKANLN